MCKQDLPDISNLYAKRSGGPEEPGPPRIDPANALKWPHPAAEQPPKPTLRPIMGAAMAQPGGPPGGPLRSPGKKLRSFCQASLHRLLHRSMLMFISEAT